MVSLANAGGKSIDLDACKQNKMEVYLCSFWLWAHDNVGEMGMCVVKDCLHAELRTRRNVVLTIFRVSIFFETLSRSFRKFVRAKIAEVKVLFANEFATRTSFNNSQKTHFFNMLRYFIEKKRGLCILGNMKINFLDRIYEKTNDDL